MNNKMKKMSEQYEEELNSLDLAQLLSVPSRAINEGLIKLCDIDEQGDVLCALYHYDEDKLEMNKDSYTFEEFEAIESIRGVGIDVRAKRVVVKSFPRTSNLIMQKIPESIDKLEESIENPSQFIRKIFSSRRKYYRYAVGALVRFFRVNDVVYSSTHRKLNFDKSKFGTDETFKEMFYKSQNTFTESDSFLTENGIVHLFIVSSSKVNTDSMREIESDKVYYITSFRIVNNNSVMDYSLEEEMRSLILSKNASNPILFSNEITYEEANKEINPLEIENMQLRENMTTEEYSNILNSIEPQYRIPIAFQPGERVAMKVEDENGNFIGIHSIGSICSKRRTKATNGKLNLFKVFCDFIGAHNSGNLNSTKIFLEVSLDLKSLKEKFLETGTKDTINLFELKKVKYSLSNAIISNMFFSLPDSRIPELFDVYDLFTSYFESTLNLLTNEVHEIEEALYQKKIQNYLGIVNKPGLINYFSTDFRKAVSSKNIRDITSKVENYILPSFCPKPLSDRYLSNLSTIRDRRVPFNLKTSKIIENSIMIFILSAQGEKMYTLINLEKIVTKYRKAKSLKKSEETTEEVE